MGEVEIHALHLGGELADREDFDPVGGPRGELVHIPYFAYVVRHPEGTVLFDTGVHPDFAEDPVSRMGPAAADFVMQLGPEVRIEAALGRLGLAPGDIDLVIQSHLHFDHTGGLYAFPDAPVMVQATELRFAEDEAAEQRDLYIAADFAAVSEWRLVEGEHDVFGDGRLTLIPTPGHTPGHQSLLVRQEDRIVFLLADATYTLPMMRARRLPGLLSDEAALLATWDLVEEIERDHDATLIATHDLDFD